MLSKIWRFYRPLYGKITRHFSCHYHYKMEKVVWPHKLTTLTSEPLLLSCGARHPGQHSFHETFQDDSRSLVTQPLQQDSEQYPSILATVDDYRGQCRDAACIPSHQISHPYCKLKHPFENSTKQYMKLVTA